MEAIKLLSCGHPPDPTPGGGWAGTAKTADGREVCGACATREEQEAFLRDETDRWFGYLATKPTGPSITTWLGGQLAIVTSHKVSRMRGFGGTYTRIHFRAIDAKGRRWYGTSPGFGMYAKLRRAKS